MYLSVSTRVVVTGLDPKRVCSRHSVWRFEVSQKGASDFEANTPSHYWLIPAATEALHPNTSLSSRSLLSLARYHQSNSDRRTYEQQLV